MFTIVTSYTTNLSPEPLARLSDIIDINVTPVEDPSETARDLLPFFHVFEKGRTLNLTEVPAPIRTPGVRKIQIQNRDLHAINVCLTGSGAELEMAEAALRRHLLALYGESFIASHRLRGALDDVYAGMTHEWLTPDGIAYALFEQEV